MSGDDWLPPGVGSAVPVIGVLGGVASGKSLVAQQLAELGAKVLDADRLGHEVLREPEVREALCQRWGAGVLDDAGEVSRSAVAQIVFSGTADSAAELDFLERLTHPRITARLREQMQRLVRDGAVALVLDAPVMLKAGWDRYCSTLVFVDAPEDQRLLRAQRRGWTPQQFAAREAAQESLEQKRRRADVIIDNSQTPQHTAEQVRRLWQSLFPAGSPPPGRCQGRNPEC
jgi:dephospho-CoA kinase